ncbi:hypothetical protein ACOMHN_024413 [Nucella lapillus]
MECRAMLWPGVHTPFQALLAGVALYLIYTRFTLFTHESSVTLPDHLSIDDVIRGDWKHDPDPLHYFPVSCLPQHRLVFIKCIHCTTEAVDMIFRRYAYRYSLPVVLPVGEGTYLGWPRPLSAQDVCPSSRGYSLLSEPAVYNYTVMKGLMRANTVFFTMVRHPLHLLESILQSVHVTEAANWTSARGGTPLQTYLRNIDQYDGMVHAQAALHNTTGVPQGFSITRNLMSHCLGMPLGFPEDRPNISADFDAVRQYIQTLDSELLLVMVMEYVDESLILLKRVMCWSFKDILHLGSGENSNSNATLSVSALTQHDRDLHRQRSAADYLLYDHFNRTFWKKVGQHSEDFWEDLEYYRYFQSRVRWFCEKVMPYGASYIQFPETKVSAAFTVTSEDCQLMGGPLLDMLKERYRQQEPRVANRSWFQRY